MPHNEALRMMLVNNRLDLWLRMIYENLISYEEHSYATAYRQSAVRND